MKKILCLFLTTALGLHYAFSDILSGSILAGGKILYDPPSSLPHYYISDGQINYGSGGESVSFCVMGAIDPSPFAQRLMTETNSPTMEELKSIVTTNIDRQYVGSNVLVKIVKLDGKDAIEAYGQRKGFDGAPDMWSDTFVFSGTKTGTGKEL